MKDIYLILHNIRSAYNVGSVFRSADGAGVKKIYLTGYTPAPLDRYGRTQKEIAKTALGAEKMISWEKRKDPLRLISGLKKEGVNIISLEQNKRSVHYKKFKPGFPLAIIAGNEVRGLPRQILGRSGTIIEIPMKGGKSSLNVSVSVAVILFHLTA